MSGFRLFPKLAFAAALSLAISVTAFAQGAGLVSSTRVAKLSAAEFNKRMNQQYASERLSPLRGFLNIYKVTYRSRDAKNRNAVLSGLVALPAQGAPNGLVVFNHGTMVSNKTVPSAYRGEAKAGET